MGNRAVITSSADLSGIGIYLHWNGGRDSVEACLEYCKLHGYRSPEQDRSYAFARLAQVIGNFFGGGSSVGIDLCKYLDCDNYDNGTYIIRGWEIVGRAFFSGPEQNEYDRKKMLHEIDLAQPEKERLGDLIDADEIPVGDVKIGDTVYFVDFDCKVKSGKVIGFGRPGQVVNGCDVSWMPFMDIYGVDHSRNINNYIRTDTARVLRERSNG